MISGQKPIVTKARTSIANFKLREGQAIGTKVTLRGDRMWEFLDRLISVAIPRIRDFRGLPAHSWDGNGNYTFGLNEQTMFAEIDPDKADQPRGMDITIVTTADDERRPARPCSRRTASPSRRAPTPTTSRARRSARAPATAARRSELTSDMAKKALINKANAKPKFKVRAYTRCQRCGRARSVYRKFGLCRVCLRELAHAGEIPGLTKSSW